MFGGVGENKILWKQTQMFGGGESSYEDFPSDDTISTLSFGPNGKFLAIGDYVGRLIFLECPQANKNSFHSWDYVYATELQSHAKEKEPK